ncbi:hypothetical protein AU509_05380 [Lonsdalea britannica]|uniref:condensation domain-containing protein n=1 Tax=Lonsdalea britannica TaxID=1082704 RepID=UPI000A264EB9|nr:condensation domain-containing protein [Lonsdalea britannica]OSM99334.1 hypothetical protein AU509_05380 [Lonsdalea britannica]
MAQVDLNLTLTETEGRCEGTLCYATALFDAGTVRRYLSYWVRMLRGMVAQPDRAVTSLPLLSADERRQRLDEVNATQADYPRDAACMSWSSLRPPRGLTRSPWYSTVRR